MEVRYVSTNTPEPLVPWGASSPLALPQQALARIKRALEEGREVGILCVVVERNERGNYVYTSSSSPLRPECSLMAVHELKAHVLKLMDAP